MKLPSRFALVALLLSSRAEAQQQSCDAAYEEAQALREAGKVASARAPLRTCGQATCPRSMSRDCVTWLGEIEARIPSVVVVAERQTGATLAGVEVVIDATGHARRIDGTAWELDPGQHTFSFIAPDGTRLEVPALIAEGQKSRRIVATLGVLPPDAAHVPERTGRRRGAFAVGGVGLVGVAVGGVFGALTLSSWSAAKDACPSLVRCPSQALADHNTAITESTVSNIALIAGGLLVAGGVVLYVTAPKDTGAAVGLRVLPGGLSVSGRF